MVLKSMQDIKKYAATFIKWSLLAILVGGIGGMVGSAFHMCIDLVTEWRTENDWLLYLLPLGGVLIAALYYICRKWGSLDTNRVLSAAAEDESVPLVMTPLIFVSATITHLLGGSAGREGAALQLGGSVGYNVGRMFRLGKPDLHVLVMAGMAAVFAALFGTPLTAAVFAIEVAVVGVLCYSALVPCVLAAAVGYGIATWLGISPVRFSGILIPSTTPLAIARSVVLSILCAIVSILFCTAIQKTERLAKTHIKNGFLRGFLGGALLLGLTFLIGSRAYNGAGMDSITCALGGEATPSMFLLKILFTAITIASGFKGGEIVPAFFVGTTFGCVAAPLLGLPPAFGAAIGFVTLFCGAVNCPLASMLLGLEVFGSEGILFFAIACAVSYMMSGPFSLYKKQKMLSGKTEGGYPYLPGR